MSKDQMLAELKNSLNSTATVEIASRERWRKLLIKFGNTPAHHEEERKAIWKEVKASRTVQRQCARNMNGLMAQIMKEFESMPEFNQLITDFQAINKSLDDEAKRIKKLTESLDKAVAALKTLEGLIKQFATLVGP